jgi:hypothetical protein
MDGMRKRMLRVTAALALLSGVAGCKTEADRQKQANDEMKFNTALQEQDNALAEQLHRSQVEGVLLSQGEAEADQLEVCFMDGGYSYPRRKNIDGSDRPISLSKRVIANCDRIMKLQERMQSSRDAEEKRKDDAYEKRHP